MELMNGLIYNLKVISVALFISKEFGKLMKLTNLQQCNKVKILKILFNLIMTNQGMTLLLNNRLGSFNHSKTSISNKIILLLFLSLIQIHKEVT